MQRLCATSQTSLQAAAHRHSLSINANKAAHLSLISSSKDTSTLAHVVGTNRSPRNRRGIPLSKELDGSLGLSVINNQRVGGGISGNGSGELAVDGIVLEHVGGVVQVEEGIVDGDGHDIPGVLHGGAADETANAAESVDTNLDSHDEDLFVESEK